MDGKKFNVVIAGGGSTYTPGIVKNDAGTSGRLSAEFSNTL